MPTALAELPRALRWIGQFDPADRPTARELLDFLTLISHNNFRRALLACLERVHSAATGPTAFYAVREVQDGERYFVDKQQQPRIAQVNNVVGSEGTVAHIIQKFCEANPATALDHPSIDTIRNSRVRNIALVDDVALSGDRIAEFINSFSVESSLRSWSSSGLLSFQVVAYAISTVAERAVFVQFANWTRLKREDRVQIVMHRAPVLGESIGDDEFADRLAGLCTRYPREMPGSSWLSHGYANNFGTIVFEHGCPNNAPALLWAPARGWTPIFPGRLVPADLAPAFEAPENALVRMARIQQLLTNAAAVPDARDLQDVLLVLSALRRRPLSERDVVHKTGMTSRSVVLILSQCFKLGLINRDRGITMQGRHELWRLRRRAPHEALAIDDQQRYVPLLLRGSRDVI